VKASSTAALGSLSRIALLKCAVRRRPFGKRSWQDQRVVDPVVEAAANNGSWCDAVCRALGLQTRWTDDAWTVAERSPGGYPVAVALSPDAEVAAVLRRVQGGRGCSVKDSFAVLDLEQSGFQVLFEATWIRRAADVAGSATTLDWHRVQTLADLEQWSEGHGLDVFVPALLDSDDIRFFRTEAATGAGFALNHSSGVVGASNVFAGFADLVTVWSDLIVVAAQTHPGFNLVGYELGADLQAALSVGFTGIGPLRVWML
jgi:hypothetical protein